MAVITLILIVAILIDCRFLKARNRGLFEQIFTITRPKLIVSILAIIAILATSLDFEHEFPILILLLIVPLFLLKRGRFMREMTDDFTRPLSLITDAIGVIVMWIYGICVFGLLLNTLDRGYPGLISEMGDLILSATFSSILILILVYRYSSHFSNKGFLSNVGLRKGNKPWSKILIPAVSFGIFFAIISSIITVTRSVQPHTPLNEVLESTRSLNLILIFFFLAICIAPILEEIIFRGYFYHVTKKWLGEKKAIYIIALTFAFLHVGQYWGDWIAISMVTLLGFTLTILRAKSGSTIASVVTHYVYNASVTIIPVIMIALTNPSYFEYKTNYPNLGAGAKEELLKTSIEEHPKFIDAYNDLAWLYAQEETKLEYGLDLIEQALQIAPDQPAFLDTKAELLEKLGRKDEAAAIRRELER